MPTRSDPAALRRGDSPPPEFDYRREAKVRIREAALNLAAFLKSDPVAIDDLEDFEVQVMEIGGQGAVLKRAARRAGEIAKEQREAARAAKRRERYPTRSAASLGAGWEDFR